MIESAIKISTNSHLILARLYTSEAGVNKERQNKEIDNRYHIHARYLAYYIGPTMQQI